MILSQLLDQDLGFWAGNIGMLHRRNKIPIAMHKPITLSLIAPDTPLVLSGLCLIPDNRT